MMVRWSSSFSTSSVTGTPPGLTRSMVALHMVGGSFLLGAIGAVAACLLPRPCKLMGADS